MLLYWSRTNQVLRNLGTFLVESGVNGSEISSGLISCKAKCCWSFSSLEFFCLSQVYVLM